MTRKLYELWPKVRARLTDGQYNRLQNFYEEVRYKITPESLGKYNWYQVIEALTFYEEHGRPALTRDEELIAAYNSFNE